MLIDCKSDAKWLPSPMNCRNTRCITAVLLTLTESTGSRLGEGNSIKPRCP